MQTSSGNELKSLLARLDTAVDRLERACHAQSEVYRTLAESHAQSGEEVGTRIDGALEILNDMASDSAEAPHEEQEAPPSPPETQEAHLEPESTPEPVPEASASPPEPPAPAPEAAPPTSAAPARDLPRMFRPGGPVQEEESSNPLSLADPDAVEEQES